MAMLVKVEVPDDAIRLFDGDERKFAREMIEAAVAFWFEKGRLSQGQAATMLGLSRGEFFDVLYRHKVSPVQISISELEEDFKSRACRMRGESPPI
jgi:predicted XRE-type DNA-binding protein